MSMTSLDYGSQFAYFWQIHNIQEPSLTLEKMFRSDLQNQESKIRTW